MRRGRNDDDGPQTDAAPPRWSSCSPRRVTDARRARERGGGIQQTKTIDDCEERAGKRHRSIGIWFNYPGNATHACGKEREPPCLPLSPRLPNHCHHPFSTSCAFYPSSRSNYLKNVINYYETCMMKVEEVKQIPILQLAVYPKCSSPSIE